MTYYTETYLSFSYYEEHQMNICYESSRHHHYTNLNCRRLLLCSPKCRHHLAAAYRVVTAGIVEHCCSHWELSQL